MIDSFVFYRSFYDAVSKLKPEAYKEAMQSILSYVFDGNDPVFTDDMAEIIYTMAKPQIDANIKRKINGSKGGRPVTETNGYEKEKPMVIEEAEKEKPNVNVNVNGNVNENVNTKAKRKVFAKPSLDDVSGYCQEQGITNVDAQHFIDYYESNGWKVGKNPMKDWKSTVRNWSRQDFRKPVTNNKIHSFDERSNDALSFESIME